MGAMLHGLPWGHLPNEAEPAADLVEAELAARPRARAAAGPHRRLPGGPQLGDGRVG